MAAPVVKVLVAILVLVLLPGTQAADKVKEEATQLRNGDTVPAAVLYALVSALSTARGDARHSDAVYHLRLVGGQQPAVDRIRVSRLLPPETHGGTDSSGGHHTSTGAAPQPGTLMSEYSHRRGGGELQSAEGGQRSPHRGPQASGSSHVTSQVPGKGRSVGIEAQKEAALHRESPLVEYSTGQMYFSPRMLFVGEDDQTDNTNSSHDSRTAESNHHTHNSGSSDGDSNPPSTYHSGSARRQRPATGQDSPHEEHHRLPRTVRRGSRAHRDRTARRSRPTRDHSSRSQSRYQADPESPSRYRVPPPITSQRHRSASDGRDRGARDHRSPREPDPLYEGEPGCPRTEQDPDGDCIKGDAGQDYPTLDTIPRTDFSCRGRPAGFYADVETRCQVWHYCTATHVQQSFLCNRGTVFNQQHLVCDWWYSVECGQSDAFHYVNDRLYIPEEQTRWGESSYKAPPAAETQQYRPQSGYRPQEERHEYLEIQQERGWRDWGKRKEQEVKERKAREREAKEREAREREAREREAWEREAREREAKEREAMKRKAKEREAWGREARARQAKEREARERETWERETREREAKVREAREREAREREAWERATRGREAKEREARERKAKEREIRERQTREREAREQEAREQQAKVRDTREKEIREQQAREQEPAQHRTRTSLQRQRAAEAERVRPQNNIPTHASVSSDSRRSRLTSPNTRQHSGRPTTRRPERPSTEHYPNRPTTQRPERSRPPFPHRHSRYSRYREEAPRRGRWIAVPRTYTAAGNLLGTPRPVKGRPPPAWSAPVHGSTPRPHIAHRGTAAPVRHASQAPRPYSEEETPREYGISSTPGGDGSLTPGTYRSSTPRPYGSSRPGSSGSTTPDPHGSTSQRPHGSTTPRPYGSAAPRPYDSTPSPHGSTIQRPYSSAAPRPHSSTTPKPYRNITPRPYSGTTPRPYSSTTPRPYSVSSVRNYASATPSEGYRQTPPVRSYGTPPPRNYRGTSASSPNRSTSTPRPYSASTGPYGGTFPPQRYRGTYPARTYRGTPAKRQQNSVDAKHNKKHSLTFSETRAGNPTSKSSGFSKSLVSPPSGSYALPYKTFPSERPPTSSPSTRPYDSSPSPRPYDSSPPPLPYDPSLSTRPYDSRPSPRPYESSPSSRPYDSSFSSRPHTSSRHPPPQVTTDRLEPDTSDAPWPLPAPPTELVVTQTARPHTTPASDGYARETEQSQEGYRTEGSPTQGHLPLPAEASGLQPLGAEELHEGHGQGVSEELRRENANRPAVTEQAAYTLDGRSVFPQDYRHSEEEGDVSTHSGAWSASTTEDERRAETAYPERNSPPSDVEKRPPSLQLDQYTIPLQTDHHATESQEEPSSPARPDPPYNARGPPAAPQHTERPPAVDPFPVTLSGAYFSATTSAPLQAGRSVRGKTRTSVPRRIKIRRRLRKVKRRKPAGEVKSGQESQKPDEKAGKNVWEHEKGRFVNQGKTSQDEGRDEEAEESKRMEVTDIYTEARTERLRTKQEEMKLRRMKAREQGRLLREEKLRRSRQEAALKTKRGERPRLQRPEEPEERRGDERRRSRQRAAAVAEDEQSSPSTTTTQRPRFTFPPYRPSKDSATPPGQLPFGTRIGKRKRYGG